MGCERLTGVVVVLVGVVGLSGCDEGVGYE